MRPVAQSTRLPCFTLWQAYPFTDEELARLMVYKAAIAAGFYTDQIGEDDQEG